MTWEGANQFKYEGWDVHEDDHTKTCKATKSLIGREEPLELSLEVCHGPIAYQGSWPREVPSTWPKTILTGSCIYSDCWKVQFASHSPKQAPPRALILGLERDREKIRKYLERGRAIVHVDVPTKLCGYQEKLLAWQVASVAEMPNVETVRYHLPVSVYHSFIDDFEKASSKQLHFMHLMLDDYADMYKQRVGEEFAAIGQNVTFYDPTHDQDGNVLDAHGADQAPYLEAVNEDHVMGLEDLAQLSISAIVAEKTGITIPCRVGVLGLPHPIKTCAGAFCSCQSFSGNDSNLACVPCQPMEHAGSPSEPTSLNDKVERISIIGNVGIKGY